MKKINKNSVFYSLSTQVVTGILTIVIYRYYTDVLSPEELGKSMLLLGVLALFDALVSSSINQTIFFEASKEEEFVKISYLLKFYINKILKLSVFLITLIFILRFYFNVFPVIIIIALVCTYLINEPIKSSALSMLNLKSSRRAYGFQIVLDATSNFILIYILLDIESSWINLIIAIITSRVISTLISSIILTKVFSHIVIKKNNLSSINFKDYFKRVKPIIFMGLIGWINNFIDRFILASSIGLSSSGIYSLSSGLVGKPYNVLTSGLTVHYKPSLFSFFSLQNKLEYKRVIFKWIISSIVLSLLTIVFFFFFDQKLLEYLVSEIYRNQILELIFYFCIAYTFVIISHSLDNIFLSRGLTKELLKIQVYLVPFGISLIFFGGYNYGLKGAVIAKLFMEFGKCLFMLFKVFKMKLWKL